MSTETGSIYEDLFSKWFSIWGKLQRLMKVYGTIGLAGVIIGGLSLVLGLCTGWAANLWWWPIAATFVSGLAVVAIIRGTDRFRTTRNSNIAILAMLIATFLAWLLTSPDDYYQSDLLVSLSRFTLLGGAAVTTLLLAAFSFMTAILTRGLGGVVNAGERAAKIAQNKESEKKAKDLAAEAKALHAEVNDGLHQDLRNGIFWLLYILLASYAFDVASNFFASIVALVSGAVLYFGAKGRPWIKYVAMTHAVYLFTFTGGEIIYDWRLTTGCSVDRIKAIYDSDKTYDKLIAEADSDDKRQQLQKEKRSKHEEVTKNANENFRVCSLEIKENPSNLTSAIFGTYDTVASTAKDAKNGVKNWWDKEPDSAPNKSNNKTGLLNKAKNLLLGSGTKKSDGEAGWFDWFAPAASEATKVTDPNKWGSLYQDVVKPKYSTDPPESVVVPTYNPTASESPRPPKTTYKPTPVPTAVVTPAPPTFISTNPTPAANKALDDIGASIDDFGKNSPK